MAHWDLAALLVALVALALTDTGRKVISSIALHLQRWVWPDHARCDLLSWNDIPDGKLHDDRHDYAHVRMPDQWGPTVRLMFKRAWVSYSRHPKFVKKPEQLDFRKHFVCVDIDTILAFIILSVGNSKCSEWDTSQLRFGHTMASFRECQGVLVVHLRGTIRLDRVTSLTKREVQLMLKGYPPFYREIVTLAHGPYMPHPIRNEHDVERGGWIIAVGFSDKSHPLALYALPNQVEDPSTSYFQRNNAGPFRNAVKRVLAVLKEVILPIFPEDSVRSVIRAVDYMVVNGTGSGVPDSGVSDISFDQLTGQQCSLAMKIFNDLKPITMEEENLLRPVLLPVLNAAFEGSYCVIQYLKDTGLQLILPTLLKEHRYKPIYLQACNFE